MTKRPIWCIIVYGGVAMRTLLKTTILALAILATACGHKTKIEVVPLTPSQQAIRDSPEEVRIRETAKVLAEEKAYKKDRAAVAKLDTPEERKVRQALERAEDRTRKAEERAYRTIEQARIEGCNPNAMRIHPDAVSHATINSSVKVRVINTSKLPVTISDAKTGPLVEGLCPGGSMTLFRSRSVVSPDMMTFQYTATARTPDGIVMVSQSEFYTLTKYDWSNGNGRQERTWFIQLQQRSW